MPGTHTPAGGGTPAGVGTSAAVGTLAGVGHSNTCRAAPSMVTKPAGLEKGALLSRASDLGGKKTAENMRDISS